MDALKGGIGGGDGTGVALGVGVAVTAAVGVAVEVGVNVGVDVMVDVGVMVGVEVAVAVGVGLGMRVGGREEGVSSTSRASQPETSNAASPALRMIPNSFLPGMVFSPYIAKRAQQHLTAARGRWQVLGGVFFRLAYRLRVRNLPEGRSALASTSAETLIYDMQLRI